jgi:hypothetical protein
LNRYCTGYKQSAFNWRKLTDCANWVRKVDDEARYFFFRHQSNWHCSPCPLSYKGHPTTGTGYQNSRIYTYRILNWRRPTWWRKYRRSSTRGRFCRGYKYNNMKTRSVPACAAHVRRANPEARFFMFRQGGNFHCAACPYTYKGGNGGTQAHNSRIYTYQIIGWRRPNFSWRRWYRRETQNRYCTGYKMNIHSLRTVEACGKYQRSKNDEVRFFFFRHEGNFHCAACPHTYKGGNRGTAAQNSRIYVYRILNWRPPAWTRDYKRITNRRYCTGYKKSAFNHRSVTACARWVRKVDGEARYFFFRHEGNYHCSPCPWTYKGHPTTGTAAQNSRIYVYRIIRWTRPTYTWSKWYRRVAFNRYCTGYTNNNFKLRKVEDCGRYIRQVNKEARFFFFREEGNYHCAACPKSYRGHRTTGTGYQKSRIYTYRILNWRPPTYPWMKWYRRVALNRYCTGYKKSAFNHRSVINCGKWVRQVDPEARFFFFREQSNWHCSPCPQSYKGGNAGTGYQNSKIFTYRILNWRRPVYSWAKWYRRVSFNRFCVGYKNNIMSLRKVEDCGKHVKSKDPYARYFFFREEGNYHCASCPPSYKGHPTTGTRKQNSRIYIYRILHWRPPTFEWSKWYKRVALNRYCKGYKKSAFNHRSVKACGDWVRSVDRTARFFFFREEGNYHCSPCPSSYNGGNAGTGYQNSRIYTYRYLTSPPGDRENCRARKTAHKRYCTGYSPSIFSKRRLQDCMAWVQSVRPNATHFFFRHAGNYHCAVCPARYKGGNAGTGYQNSPIYTYKINCGGRPRPRPVRPDGGDGGSKTPGGGKGPGGKGPRPIREVNNRYCTGYRRSAFNHRNLTACFNWVRRVDRSARWFFFRHEGNYHCSPCPGTYRGGNRGTGYQKSRIYIYRIHGWRGPGGKGPRPPIRPPRPPGGGGVRPPRPPIRPPRPPIRPPKPPIRPPRPPIRPPKPPVRPPRPPIRPPKPPVRPPRPPIRPPVRPPRPPIRPPRPPIGGRCKPRKTAHKRYCTGYGPSIFSKRSLHACAAWVRRVRPNAKHFFFRHAGNYHCAACPASYKGGNARTGYQNSPIYTYRFPCMGGRGPGGKGPRPPKGPGPRPPRPPVRPPGGGYWIIKLRNCSQSSPYANNRFPCQNAYNGSGRFTHTNRGVGMWWRASFGRTFTVHRCWIRNRRDCCGQRLAGTRVMIGNQECARLPGRTPNGKSWTLNCRRPIRGSFVKLITTRNEYLSITGIRCYGRGRRPTGPTPRPPVRPPRPPVRPPVRPPKPPVRPPKPPVRPPRPPIRPPRPPGGRWYRFTCRDVSQSSPYANNRFPACNAVNGSGRFTHTNKGVNQWWRGRMRHAYRITRIRIRNRRDCCGQRLARTKVLVDGRECGRMPGRTANGRWYEVRCNLRGREIKLVTVQNTYLSITGI